MGRGVVVEAPGALAGRRGFRLGEKYGPELPTFRPDSGSVTRTCDQRCGTPATTGKKKLRPQSIPARDALPFSAVNRSDHSYHQPGREGRSRPHGSAADRVRIVHRSRALSYAPHTRLCARARIGRFDSSAIHGRELIYGGSSLPPATNPPQLARLVIGSLPSLTEELGPRQRYSLIVLVRNKPCEQLRKAIEFVVGNRVGSAWQCDEDFIVSYLAMKRTARQLEGTTKRARRNRMRNAQGTLLLPDVLHGNCFVLTACDQREDDLSCAGGSRD